MTRISKQKALILIAHGSRREASNDEVRDVGAKIFSALDSAYKNYFVAFLELADPLIPTAIEKAAALGANHIDVFPYFLSKGRHVTEDIPREVESALENLKNPVTWNYLPYLGSGDTIVQIASQLITDNPET